jgi:hypothetical protein
MRDLREAAEMALEALRNAEVVYMEQLNAMYALQEALAQPEQEPVAWVECAVIPWLQSKDTNVYAMTKLHRIPNENYDTPLYTAPPKREWVGLTDEEAREIRLKVGSAADVYARAIEAALKEKNT